MTEPTEEMRARAREEARELLARVMAGDDSPKRSRKQGTSSSIKREAPHRTKSEAARKYDHDEFKRLYLEENISSYDIAEKFGCSRKTVTNALIKMKVWEPAREGKGGRPLSEVCAKGHDQSVWRRKSSSGRKKQDWHCAKCHQEYNAEYKRKKAERLRDNRLIYSAPTGENDGWVLMDLILEGQYVGQVFVRPEVGDLLHTKLQNLSQKKTLKKVVPDGK